MKILAIFALMALSIVYPAAYAGARAQVATPSPTESVAMVTLEELSSEPMLLSLVRTTLAEGESLQVTSGSGPAVFYAEEGTISMDLGDGMQPPQVSRQGDGATPALSSQEVTGISAGETVVLSPGTTSTMSNESTSPVSLLTLIAAPDATLESTGDVEPSLLVSRELAFPEPPVVVTLDRVVVLPGDRLTLPEEPTLFVFATVDRGDAYLLSGQGFNRGKETLAVYILAVSQP